MGGLGRVRGRTLGEWVCMVINALGEVMNEIRSSMERTPGRKTKTSIAVCSQRLRTNCYDMQKVLCIVVIFTRYGRGMY